jgi:hypothetical protein
LPVDEPVNHHVEARCVHAALCEDDCKVRDALRRDHGAPLFNANERHRQGRLGLAQESWSTLVLASAEAGAAREGKVVPGREKRRARTTDELLCEA